MESKTPDLITLSGEKLAFDHNHQSETARDILRLCGPVFGPLDALMKASYDEHARTKPITDALLKVAEASQKHMDASEKYRCSFQDVPEEMVLIDARNTLIEALAELEKAVRGG